MARRYPVVLVLLDVMLPEMGGFDVCRLLQDESDADTLLPLDVGADGAACAAELFNFEIQLRPPGPTSSARSA